MSYPKDIHAFYMRMNDDGRTVAAMDVLAPGIGEIIGDSQLEERLDLLDARMAECHIDRKHYAPPFPSPRAGPASGEGSGRGSAALRHGAARHPVPENAGQRAVLIGTAAPYTGGKALSAFRQPAEGDRTGVGPAGYAWLSRPTAVDRSSVLPPIHPALRRDRVHPGKTLSGLPG